MINVMPFLFFWWIRLQRFLRFIYWTIYAYKKCISESVERLMNFGCVFLFTCSFHVIIFDKAPALVRARYHLILSTMCHVPTLLNILHEFVILENRTKFCRIWIVSAIFASLYFETTISTAHLCSKYLYTSSEDHNVEIFDWRSNLSTQLQILPNFYK